MALNDVAILGSITIILLASAFFLPMIQEAFNIEETTTFDSESYTEGVQESAQEISKNSVSAFTPITIIKMFFSMFKLVAIGFAGIPFWLDFIYTFMGFMWILLAVKWFPTIGSGG